MEQKLPQLHAIAALLWRIAAGLLRRRYGTRRGRVLHQMAKILGLTGSFVGGTIGWWLGAFFGTMTAFMVSMIGTGLGLYVGRRIANDFM